MYEYHCSRDGKSRWLLAKEVRDEFDSRPSPFDALKRQKIGPTFARIIARML